MTIWPDSEKISQKYCLTFGDRWHTPIFKSTKYNIWLTYFIREGQDVFEKAKRMAKVLSLSRGLKLILSIETGRKFNRKIDLKKIPTSSDAVSEKYGYEIKNFIGGAIIGNKMNIPTDVLNYINST